MPPKSARAKSPSPKPKNPVVSVKHRKDGKSEYILPGKHTDDGKPMVSVEREFIDDESMFWMAFTFTCLSTIRTCWTWCIWAWINFMLSALVQYVFVFRLKLDNPPVVKMYIFISSAVLITAFSDCVVDCPWVVWVDWMHPLQFFEFRWWCSAANQLECIVRTYTNTSKTMLFLLWVRIWTLIPRVSAWVHCRVSV
jgi:hypothetical protein